MLPLGKLAGNRLVLWAAQYPLRVIDGSPVFGPFAIIYHSNADSFDFLLAMFLLPHPGGGKNSLLSPWTTDALISSAFLHERYIPSVTSAIPSGY